MLVNNKGNYSYEAEGVVLIPGTNMLGEKEFEKFIAHPLMAQLDKQGEFVYDKDKTKPAAKDVIALIDDTFDVEVLEAIKEDDDRKTVQDAVEKRIEELKNPNK